MSGSDYLWDGSGEPDPEIVRLEAALRPLRRVPPPPPLVGPVARWRLLAVAAAVLLALGTLPRPRPAEPAAWGVAWLDGKAGSDRLREGELLDTGERRARVDVGSIGQVQLGPATRVSLVDGGRRAHRLALERGTLHAMIWAPPGQFLVDTRSARAIDLGCEYTLEAAPDGTSLLRVASGWVGFEHAGTRSLVPAGAWCRTRPGAGPGTPRFASATPAFVAALDAIDAESAGGPAGDRRDTAGDSLARVLSEARVRDAFSLWHLLTRVGVEQRRRVYDALAARVPPPAGVTPEGVERGDPGMLALWWDELGLGSSAFWGSWTGPWTGSAAPRGAVGAREVSAAGQR